MKKGAENIFRFCILAGLAVVLAFTEGDVFAQAKWLPEISINLPCILEHRETSDCPDNKYDTSWEKSGVCGIDAHRGDILKNYYRSGNSISISMTNRNVSSMQITISFVLDTVKKTLNNFKISNRIPSSGFGAPEIESSIICSDLEYKIIGDTIISVAESALSFQGKIENVTCDVLNGGKCPDGPFFFHVDDSFKSFLDGLDFSIYFILTKPTVSVSTQDRTNIEYFTVNTSFLDHSIHFSFPSSSHTQTILIYDILGREISKIEIPAGSTSYVLPSARFPNGTYFARLGGSSAHFVIE